jgi:hypothetical protein
MTRAQPTRAQGASGVPGRARSLWLDLFHRHVCFAAHAHAGAAARKRSSEALAGASDRSSVRATHDRDRRRLLALPSAAVGCLGQRARRLTDQADVDLAFDVIPFRGLT